MDRLTEKTRQLLHKSGIDSIEELRTKSRDDLMKVRGLGNKAMKEIEELIEEKPMSREEFEAVLLDPLFWKEWNMPNGKEIRKKMMDTLYRGLDAEAKAEALKRENTKLKFKDLIKKLTPSEHLEVFNEKNRTIFNGLAIRAYEEEFRLDDEVQLVTIRGNDRLRIWLYDED